MAPLLARARAARADGDLVRALQLARAAREAVPGEAAPAFLLCALLLEHGDAEAASLLPIVEGFPGFGPGWEELGMALLPRQPAAATVAFARAAQAYAAQEMGAHAAGGGAAVAHRLGVVLRQCGDLPAARAAFERAVARDGALHQAWFALGLVCQDMHDGAAAAASFRAALGGRADFHEAAFNLGVTLQEDGDMEAALDAYALAWRLRPESFGRIAQALVSPAVGKLWLHPAALRRDLAARQPGPARN